MNGVTVLHIYKWPKNQMAFNGVNNRYQPLLPWSNCLKELSSSPPNVPGALFGGRGAKHRQLGGSRCWEDFIRSRKIHQKKHRGKYTPEDERLEPKNHPIEKENHLPTPSFSGSMLIFQGVLLKKSWKTTWDVTNFCKEWAFLQKQLVSRILSINRIAGN